MNLSITARIVLGFSTALLALLVIGSVAYRNLISLKEDVERVEHTLEVLQENERLSTRLFEIQSIARGYALSGDPTAPQQLTAASQRLQQSLSALRALTIDNPIQQRRLDRLETLLQQRVQTARDLMESRDASQLSVSEGVVAIVTEGNGLTNSISDLNDEIEGMERQLLTEREDKSKRAQAMTSSTLTYGTLAAAIFVALSAVFLTRSIRTQLRELLTSAGRIARGDYAERVAVRSNDEVGQLATAFNVMAEQVERRQESIAAENWLRASLAKLSKMFEGERRLDALGAKLLAELAALLQVQRAALYLRSEHGDRLELLATYADDGSPSSIVAGQGLVGQVLRDRERLVLNDVPDDYARISSALGSTRPRSIVIVPALLSGEVKAIVELGFLQPCTPLQLGFLEQLAESLGLVLTTIQANDRTRQLLVHSEAMTVELQAQAERLQESEQLLKEQQEELRQTNEELEQANEELQQANLEMEERATLLAEQK
ncbi:MAG TPA: CHASE3 domain-containing protein, partial [Steroidobacteraceae bacterium]|nr:CHASE3 domain-containing protein [Steroidobacteraceae bacterium]